MSFCTERPVAIETVNHSERHDGSQSQTEVDRDESRSIQTNDDYALNRELLSRNKKLAGRTAGTGFKKISVKPTERRKYIIFSDAETSRQDIEEFQQEALHKIVNSDDDAQRSTEPKLKLKKTKRAFED